MAEELIARGHEVIVPTLVNGAVAGSWTSCVDAAAAQTRAVDGAVVLVGHSGAGPLLPLIAQAMKRRPARLVFVDAAIPSEEGEAALMPDEFAEHLRSLAHDDGGVLPPWSDWFGPDTIASLVPDERRRHDLIADMPRVPLRYFDARITIPDGWSQVTAGAYILLSEIYRPDAIEARSRGWPVIEMDGGHLDVVTQPAEVADAILSLAPPP